MGGKKILNLNDSLVSAPSNIMQHLLQQLKPICGQVDYLLTSYGGAASFPNRYSMPGKNDREVAFLKEMYVLDNTCQVIAELQPRNVIFFASDYVLLHPQQQWMNDIKISRQEAADYYAAYCRERNLANAVQFIEMYPGDSIDNDQELLNSPYHQLLRSYSRNELVQQLYAPEIAALQVIQPVAGATIEACSKVLSRFMEQKKKQVPSTLHPQLVFDICITDAATPTYLHVDLGQSNPVNITNAQPTTAFLKSPSGFRCCSMPSTMNGAAM